MRAPDGQEGCSTGPTSSKPQPGSGPARSYLRHLFSLSFEIALRIVLRTEVIFHFVGICSIIPSWLPVHGFRVSRAWDRGGWQMRLPNYVSGRWGEGLGSGELLVDPVTGDELVSISSAGMDLEAGLQVVRVEGGTAVRRVS